MYYLLQNAKVTQPDDGPYATKNVVKMHSTCKVREGVKCVKNYAWDSEGCESLCCNDNTLPLLYSPSHKTHFY
jgi:hypothetical protein